jgi:hypothetical protein
MSDGVARFERRGRTTVAMMPTMLDETIARLQAEVESPGMTPERRAELLRLLTTLRAEVAELGRTNAESATSIAAFAHLSAHEATRSRPRRELLELSLAGLRKSVDQLEATHPRLVEAAGSLARSLSGLGI